MSNMAKCIKMPNITCSSSSPSPFHAKGAWYALPNVTNHRIDHAIESLVALLRLQSISRQCSAIGSSLDSMGLQTIPSGGGEFTAVACATFAHQGVLSPLWSTMVQVPLIRPLAPHRGSHAPTEWCAMENR